MTNKHRKANKMELDEYTSLWHFQDEIRATVEASGYAIWSLRQRPFTSVLRLELSTHIGETEAEQLCSQFTLAASYEGEGDQGSLFSLYL